jgi:hypothetical protein
MGTCKKLLQCCDTFCTGINRIFNVFLALAGLVAVGFGLYVASQGGLSYAPSPHPAPSPSSTNTSSPSPTYGPTPSPTYGPTPSSTDVPSTWKFTDFATTITSVGGYVFLLTTLYAWRGHKSYYYNTFYIYCIVWNIVCGCTVSGYLFGKKDEVIATLSLAVNGSKTTLTVTGLDALRFVLGATVLQGLALMLTTHHRQIILADQEEQNRLLNVDVDHGYDSLMVHDAIPVLPDSPEPQAARVVPELNHDGNNNSSNNESASTVASSHASNTKQELDDNTIAQKQIEHSMNDIKKKFQEQGVNIKGNVSK